MTSTLSSRKLSELQLKVAALKQTFQYWRSLTLPVATGESLALHTSQIQRLIGDSPAGVLEELRVTLASRVLKIPIGDEREILAKGPRLERTTMATHALWAYFRDKFAQRFDSDSRRFLDAVSELSWRCYLPARDAAQGKNEQPLCFLANTGGPSFLAKGRGFNPAGVGDVAEQADFEAVLQALPISVISVPVTGRGYLPDGIFVAHETGHAVEADFKLSQEVRNALTSAVPDVAHQSKWVAWCSEMFADAWAVVHTGSAYVGALQDFLSATAFGDSSENYPSERVRVALNRQMLRTLGLNAEADACAQTWTDAGFAEADAEWAGDLPQVAAALLQTRLSVFNQSIETLNSGTAARDAAARAQANRRLTETDPRILFAAMRFCHESDPSALGANEGALVDSFLDQLQPAEAVKRTIRRGGRSVAPVLAKPATAPVRRSTRLSISNAPAEPEPESVLFDLLMKAANNDE